MKKNNWFSRHYKLTLTGIIALFSAVVFGNMTRWSIWFDEGFSAYLVRFNFGEITHFTALDVHPPFYYWMLKAWTLLFGTTPLALRSLSWLFAVAALIGVFMLVRRALSSTSYALVATLGFSLTPLLIRYTDEARMYTLVLAIVVWATYFLLRAVATNQWKWWVGYAVLISIGMLTHYLIALAWLSHWAWRYLEYRRREILQFFTKQWIGAHALAVLLFAWWVPHLIAQFTTVQGGFWVPLVNARTPVDFLSNALMYRQGAETNNWWSVLVGIVIGYVVAASIVAFRTFRAKQRSGAVLLAVLAVVPPLLLILISMPPLKSTFVDRYVLYAACMLFALAAIGTLALKNKHPRLALFGACILLVTAGLGSMNVYHYGNYNKNSNVSIRTGDVIAEIAAQGTKGEPIITSTPWMYFEAAPYTTSDHPVYFTKASVTQNYGSLAMLKERNIGRIDSLSEFTSSHRYVWYLDNPHADQPVKPPVASWKAMKQIDGHDDINRETMYRAVLYDTQN